jgi:ribosomal protein S18 acetylase RimI-like enzyme
MNGTLTQVPARGTSLLAAGATARGRYCVRPADPADDAAIREFLCGLSVRTQYLRFFTAMCPPSRGLLKALTAGHPRADILLVTGEDGQVVGHGMAVDAPGERAGSADLGLVIADDWQGQGLGPVLLRLLEQRAAARGITTVVLDVLPENRRMLGIVDRRWPAADRRRTLDSINITAPVTGALPVPGPVWRGAGHAA